MKSPAVIAVLLTLPGLALAGPNAGGTIFFHDADVAYESGVPDYCGTGADPVTCDQADVRIDTGIPMVWKAYAAFPEDGNPRLKAVSFGIEYNAGDVVIVDTGKCAGFELPESGWPAPGSGTALVFSQAQTDHLVEFYWFAGYCYSTTP